MIALLMLAAALATPSPSPSPSPSPLPPDSTSAPTATPAPSLPSIAKAYALPYPAYGTPQPQVIVVRSDPKVPTAVTLQQATSIAIARIPSLAAARAQVALEAAALQLERTGLAPNLSISGSATNTYTQGGSSTSYSTTVGSASTQDTYQSNIASVSLTQLIFDGGQIRARIDAASLTRDATLATYRRSAQSVAYTVATQYYQVLLDARAVAVDVELLHQYEVSEGLVRAQIAAGTEAGADLATQLAITASARATLVEAQGTLQIDRVAFAAALGLEADINVLPVDDTQSLAKAVPDAALPAYESALTIAYAERPDFDEAGLTVRSNQASLRAAQRGLSPTLSFAGSKGIESESPGGGVYRNDSSLGLDLSIPVYDQGITRANVASSRASLAIAIADAATTRLTVGQDVRQALIAIVSDRATLEETRIAYTSSLSALRSNQAQYRAGVSTLPALVQAEATLATAATNIVNAIYAERLAQSKLRYAMGTILQ
jgi:outer membrane protein